MLPSGKALAAASGQENDTCYVVFQLSTLEQPVVLRQEIKIRVAAPETHRASGNANLLGRIILCLAKKLHVTFGAKLSNFGQLEPVERHYPYFLGCSL